MKTLFIKPLVLLLLLPTTGARSDNSQFICNDWETTAKYTNTEGTRFIGKKTNDGFIIKNKYRYRIELKYLGNWNNDAVKLYSGTNPKWQTTEVYGVATGNSKLNGYDWKFVQFGFNHNARTECINE